MCTAFLASSPPPGWWPVVGRRCQLLPMQRPLRAGALVPARLHAARHATVPGGAVRQLGGIRRCGLRRPGRRGVLHGRGCSPTGPAQLLHWSLLSIGDLSRIPETVVRRELASGRVAGRLSCTLVSRSSLRSPPTRPPPLAPAALRVDLARRPAYIFRPARGPPRSATGHPREAPTRPP